MTKSLLVLLVMTLPLLMGASSGGSSSSSSGSSATPKYEKYFNKGVKAQDKRDYAAAVKWYEKALKEKPDHADSWNNLGFTLRMVGKEYMKKAGEAYQQALKVDRNHDEALEYQGELYLWWGKLTDANQNLQRLKKMNSPEAKELEEKLDAILQQARLLI